MPNWDDPRGYRREPGRWREWMREAGRRGERRTFDEPGRYGEPGPEPWRRDRYAARYDQERAGYAPDEAGYGGEAHAHPDHVFDAEYLRWRDEQLRAHDRDYEEWRREQHRRYDEQYRQFRNERQRHFGEAFHMWRSHRGVAGGLPDTPIGSAGQGQGGYGDKSGNPGGYNAPGSYDRPTGYLDPPGHLSADPAMSQVGGYTGPLTQGSGGDGTPEFGKEPRQVQSAAGGPPHASPAQDRTQEPRPAPKGEEPQRH